MVLIHNKCYLVQLMHHFYFILFKKIKLQETDKEEPEL